MLTVNTSRRKHVNTDYILGCSIRNEGKESMSAAAKKITVIVGNPYPGSLDHALADSYRRAAEAAGAQVRTIDLALERFVFTAPQKEQLRVESADEISDDTVRRMVDDVLWAEHLVFVYPVWWGTYPAALKGFIDRVFISGVAYRYIGSKSGWEKLLKGRTARLLLTMDSPKFWDRLKYRSASENSLRHPILWYCGVKTVGITRYTKVRTSTLEQRSSWLTQSAKVGSRDGATK